MIDILVGKSLHTTPLPFLAWMLTVAKAGAKTLSLFSSCLFSKPTDVLKQKSWPPCRFCPIVGAPYILDGGIVRKKKDCPSSSPLPLAKENGSFPQLSTLLSEIKGPRRKFSLKRKLAKEMWVPTKLGDKPCCCSAFPSGAPPPAHIKPGCTGAAAAGTQPPASGAPSWPGTGTGTSYGKWRASPALPAERGASSCR